MKAHAMPDAVFPFVDGVKSVSNCSLKLSGAPWPFALKYAADIDAHWQAATKSNSSYFNGIVHLIDSVRFGDDVLEATLTRTDFKSYLYWRLSGYPEAGVLDGFGSAIIRSSDGDILLAQQMPGNVNYGFACLPSGFIDARDVQPDGTIDIARSIAREIAEELGAVGTQVEREGHFIVARSGMQLCFAILFNAALSTAEIMRLVDEHNATSDDPELEVIIPVASLADIAEIKMLPYARALLEALFAAR